MEFKSLQDLVRIVENAMAVQFYGQSSTLRKGVLKVLAHVLGAMLYMMTLIAKRIWKNRFVSTCDVSALDGFGAEYGIPHKAPVCASGKAKVTLADGTESVEIEQGAALIDPVTKKEYEVITTTTVSASNLFVPVAAIHYGADSDVSAGAVLEFRDSDVDGVESIESAGIVGGKLEGVEVDGEVQVWGELAEEYRARLVNRIQNPPHGGAANDYWQWGMSFTYVSDAYVFANTPNSNSVTIALANYSANDLSVSADQVAEVSDYINDDSRRPITADVRVLGVTAVNVGISARLDPMNESVKESVISSIKQYLRGIGPGKTVDLAQMSVDILSNSTASRFSITSATKDGYSVTSLEFVVDTSDADPENWIAEIAKVDDADIVLENWGV